MAEDKRENDPDNQLTPANQPTGEEAEEGLPIPPEVLDNMPPEMRSEVTRAFSSITQVAAPIFNPVLQRVTSDHLTQIINNVDTQSDREAEA